MSAKKSNQRYKSESKSFNWYLLPVAFIIGLLPLIVHMKEFSTNLENEVFFDTSDRSTDFFLLVKSYWFIGASAIMLAIVLVKLAIEKKQIKFTKLFIPLGIYGLLVALSSFLSDHKPFPYTGIFEQFESMWVLLGYCILTYYAYLVVDSLKDLSLLMAVLTVSTIIIILLGVTQAFGTDFFRTDLGKLLILPSEIYKDVELRNQITFNFEPGRVYLTFYNPNYVGSYASLLMPLFVMLIFTTSRKWLKAIYGVVAAGLIMVLYYSQSRAGFIGMLAAALLLLVLFNKQLIKNWYPTLLVLIIFVGSFYTLNNYSNGLITNKFKAAFSSNTKREFNLTSIETLDDYVELTYKGQKLLVMFDYDYENGFFSITPLDESFQTLACDNDELYRFTITDERFKGTYIQPISLDTDLVGFEVNIDHHPWYFANVNGSYYIRSSYGKLVKAQSSRTFEPLERRGSFASGRGFIWARTLPLLGDNFVIGSGADTYIFEFPNYDFLALYNGGYEGQVITKPHNLYLQIGVQSGVLSLLAVIVFYLIYFLSSVKLYIRNRVSSPVSFIGMGILAGSFGYMVVGIINDSTLALAPIFWALMGLGIATNAIYKKTASPKGGASF